MTERRVGAQQQRRLEREGFTLEVTRAGKRFWREPRTERRLSGDHAFELVERKEARTLEEAGWERAGEVERETYWRRPDSGRLYPQGAAYDVVQGVPRMRGRKTHCERVWQRPLRQGTFIYP